MLLKLARYLHRRLCRHYALEVVRDGPADVCVCLNCGLHLWRRDHHAIGPRSLLPQEGDSP